MTELTQNIHIFLDLDGVIADFDAHAAAQGKRAENGDLKWDELDHQWWSTMPAFSGARAFYDALKNTGIVKFLTAPVLHEGCFSGKAAWVRNFVPERGISILKDLIICSSADKYYLASSGHVLIDDREKNVGAWISGGGIGIHHTGDFEETLKKFREAIAA